MNAKRDPETLAKAREYFPKGSKVFCILRKVSRSGMRRIIGLATISCTDEGPVVLHRNLIAAEVLGRKPMIQDDGIQVEGCGTDMGFELYGDGYALSREWL